MDYCFVKSDRNPDDKGQSTYQESEYCLQRCQHFISIFYGKTQITNQVFSFKHWL